MEIIFRTDEDIRKLVAVYDMLAPPDSPLRRVGGYAPLVSKELFVAVQALNLLRSLDCGRQGSVWLALLGEKGAERSLSEAKFSHLKKLLAEIDFPLDKKGFRRVKRFSEKFQINADKAKVWVKKIFGKSLPEKVVIIPFGYPLYFSNSGTMLVRSPVVVGMTMGYRDDKTYLGVLLHEILHALVKDEIKRPRSSYPSGWFEEALLGYFVPGGILAEKIGLLKKLDLEELRERNAQGRRYAAEESEKLFPVMKEYYPICGKKTIWEFLKEKGFGNYLKVDTP